MEREKTRNLGIDILKSIGIILIILAHMGIPKVLFQLRNFDVVLLVILSGFLSVKSYKSNQSFYKYIKKRFIRLIIPVWIFLTIFFGIFAISGIGKEGETFCFNTIFRTYTLIDGIGYVWIFRVYMLCAISVPLLLKLKKKLNKNIYYAFIIGIYIIYEMIYIIIGEENIFLKYVVFYFLPYGILTFLGMEISEWNQRLYLKLQYL